MLSFRLLAAACVPFKPEDEAHRARVARNVSFAFRIVSYERVPNVLTFGPSSRVRARYVADLARFAAAAVS
jgi:hypothetical protein